MNYTELRSLAMKNYLATGGLCFSNSPYNVCLFHASNTSEHLQLRPKATILTHFRAALTMLSHGIFACIDVPLKCPEALLHSAAHPQPVLHTLILYCTYLKQGGNSVT